MGIRVPEVIIDTVPDEGDWRLKIMVTREGEVKVLVEPYRGDRMTYSLKSVVGHSSIPEAQVKGFPRAMRSDERLYTSSEEVLLETSVSNIFWKVGEKCFTPDPELPLYYGTTLRCLKLSFEHVKARLEDIPPEAHLYLCNALRGVKPVIQVDERVFARDLLFERFCAELLDHDGQQRENTESDKCDLNVPSKNSL